MPSVWEINTYVHAYITKLKNAIAFEKADHYKPVRIVVKTTFSLYLMYGTEMVL
jgi:hypothetical protein